MSFANRVIVITGASEGIGAEIARQLCSAQATPQSKLVLAARRIEPLQAVAAQCQALGAEAIAVRCDVSVETDCFGAECLALRGDSLQRLDTACGENKF